MPSTKETMSPEYGLRILFRCPRCDHENDEIVEDAYFDWSAEPLSDGISTARDVVTCDGCKDEVDVEVVANPGSKSVKLVNYPDTEVSYVPSPEVYDDYESFLYDYVPTDAYDVYRNAMRDIEDMAYPVAGVVRKQSLMRMLYLHYIGIMEAYLSDRLINIILSDQAKLIKLIRCEPKLSKIRIGLAQAAADSEASQKSVKRYLQDFPFHKLKMVSKFYKAVLDIDMLPDRKKAKVMDEIVTVRHHLAHRNGLDNDGKRVEISEDELVDVRLLVTELIERIDKQYQEYIIRKHFDPIEGDDQPQSK